MGVSRLAPGETALVVVDVQERLAAAMPRREQTVKAIRVLLRLARHTGMPVLVTQQYTRGLGPTVPELAADLGGTAPCEKITFSCCGEEGFNAALDRAAAAGRRTVLLTGMETHVCVFLTALDLLDRGFAVRIPWDATCSRSDENRDRALDLLARDGVTVTSSETEAFSALVRAGTPEFKDISALVK
jgi:nicotinamidase-related amidase